MKHKLPINGEWVEFTDEQLDVMTESGHEGRVRADYFREMLSSYEQNPLAFFLPHGLPWSKEERIYGDGAVVIPPSHYDKKFGNDGAAFVSDFGAKYPMFVASRKTGKSVHGAVFVGNRTMETDPNWPMFKANGVEYRPFEGPTTAVIASFSWPNVGELWEAYREILPRYELGPYAKDWGKYPGEEGRARNLTFGDGRPKALNLMRSKSRYIFLCYTQPQHVWENFKAKILHADEQITISKLVAWEDGSRNMGDYTPAIFTLSGFVIPERPHDTGAAGPIKREIYDGHSSRGQLAARYHNDIESTPDAIISPAKKKEAYDLYVNPKIERSEKQARRGLATYWPGWEPGGGLVFEPDVWNKELHVIEPLWEDDKAPHADNVTLYRSGDYGKKGISCFSWIGVTLLGKIPMLTGKPLNPGTDENMLVAFLYRVLYERGLLGGDLAQRVIDMSHNSRRKLRTDIDGTFGVSRDFYEEIHDKQGSECYYESLLDGRSFANTEQAETIGDLLYRHGLDLIPASGKRNSVQIDSLKDWMRLDFRKVHPWAKKKGKPRMGCPRFFIFDGAPGITAAIDEIEGLGWSPNDPGKLNPKDPDHWVDTAKYWAQNGPLFMGELDEIRRNLKSAKKHSEDDYTPYTGY